MVPGTINNYPQPDIISTVTVKRESFFVPEYTGVKVDLKKPSGVTYATAGLQRSGLTSRASLPIAFSPTVARPQTQGDTFSRNTFTINVTNESAEDVSDIRLFSRGDFAIPVGIKITTGGIDYERLLEYIKDKEYPIGRMRIIGSSMEQLCDTRYIEVLNFNEYGHARSVCHDVIPSPNVYYQCSVMDIDYRYPLNSFTIIRIPSLKANSNIRIVLFPLMQSMKNTNPW